MFEVVEAVELVRKLVGEDPVGGSAGELCDAAVAWEQLVSLATLGAARATAALDASGVCDAEHGLSTVTWLAREASLPGGVARDRVRVGKTLGGWPATPQLRPDLT